MKHSQLYLLICLPLIFINLFAVLNNISWLIHLSEILIFVPPVFAFFSKLDFKNINLFGFLVLSVLAVLLKFFEKEASVYLISNLFSMLSYSFLIREALNYTKRETGNKFMLIFFFLLIGLNVYFVVQHIQELEIYMAGIIEFGVYSIYYINLLVLAIVALIYYLNSYSRKSVFFITLVMAIVVSDILRDMALFYFPDTSVLLMNNFLGMSAVILSFLFFATEEKKLRLINLV
ncbi:hypothetical protein [Christiangramia forsetii]|uniref:Membrane protein n=2 Tax=Christiangramia forsetii TaxID=411153 RepID=A0LZ28_CHRFK|nr:hypothetical protein [Christiangramia forsetii]CAL65623.1 membrane protein [Christiangramia forsetii KT0803]